MTRDHFVASIIIMGFKKDETKLPGDPRDIYKKYLPEGYFITVKVSKKHVYVEKIFSNVRERIKYPDKYKIESVRTDYHNARNYIVKRL